MNVLVLNFVVFISVCHGQTVGSPTTTPDLRNRFTEIIGNFSVELLYHTSKVQPKEKNLIVSPITVWTTLAVMSEGATGNTKCQINNAIRMLKKTDAIRSEYINTVKCLQVEIPYLELTGLNAIFVDQNRLPLEDFRESARQFYDVATLALDFSKAEEASKLLNNIFKSDKHGNTTKLFSPKLFSDRAMVLASALNFKREWTLPFTASSTAKLPFFSSDGKKIGEVNMMFNRHTYPFANLLDLQARVIELPYGEENRLSMLVMVPHPGVLLEDMILNFKNVTIDKVFDELKIAKREHGHVKVDCFLPRFKSESIIDMTPILRERFAITDLFDFNIARLPNISRIPLYVSKVIHRAQIEVTEVGTVATRVTAAGFSNRFPVIRFEANRPFAYMIIEKVSNSIIFGGFYQEPSLY